MKRIFTGLLFLIMFRAAYADGDQDPLKHIPLNSSGSIWTSFGGQFRERDESWNHFQFGASGPHGVYTENLLLTRILLYQDLHLGNNVRIFLEGKGDYISNRLLTGGIRTQDADDSDLEAAFFDLKFPISKSGHIGFQAGRQEFAFGNQRLIGTSDWSNSRRSFDGVDNLITLGNWTITTFSMRPVLIRLHSFDVSDPTSLLTGSYAAGFLPALKSSVDLYWIRVDHTQITWDGIAGPEERDTFGLRFQHQISENALDYELETATQSGSLGANSIHGFMFTGGAGYTLREWKAAPRFYTQYDYASGSQKYGQDIGTFDTLYPSRHSAFGFMDQVGRANLIDLRFGASVAAAKNLSVSLERHAYWRASTGDALYDSNGNIFRSAAAGTAADIGSEWDLRARYNLDRHTMLETGIGHFSAGTFIKQSGPSSDINFVYASTQYTF